MTGSNVYILKIDSIYWHLGKPVELHCKASMMANNIANIDIPENRSLLCHWHGCYLLIIITVGQSLGY